VLAGAQNDHDPGQRRFDVQIKRGCKRDPEQQAAENNGTARHGALDCAQLGRRRGGKGCLLILIDTHNRRRGGGAGPLVRFYADASWRRARRNSSATGMKETTMTTRMMGTRYRSIWATREPRV